MKCIALRISFSLSCLLPSLPPLNCSFSLPIHFPPSPLSTSPHLLHPIFPLAYSLPSLPPLSPLPLLPSLPPLPSTYTIPSFLLNSTHGKPEGCTAADNQQTTECGQGTYTFRLEGGTNLVVPSEIPLFGLCILKFLVGSHVQP